MDKIMLNLAWSELEKEIKREDRKDPTEKASELGLVQGPKEI